MSEGREHKKPFEEEPDSIHAFSFLRQFRGSGSEDFDRAIQALEDALNRDPRMVREIANTERLNEVEEEEAREFHRSQEGGTSW